MAATRVDGELSLVYLVFNTIFNLTTQDGQVACFANAAAHLRSEGRFVIEARVPELQRLPLGPEGPAVARGPRGLSFSVYDMVTQRARAASTTTSRRAAIRGRARPRCATHGRPSWI